MGTFLGGKQLGNILNYSTLKSGGILGGFDSKTNSGSTQTLCQFVLPANTITQIGSGIKVSGGFNCAANNDNKEVDIIIGGFFIQPFVVAAPNNIGVTFEVYILKADNIFSGTTKDCLIYGFVMGADNTTFISDNNFTGPLVPQGVINGMDWTIDNSLKFNVICDHANDITKTAFIVEVI